MKWTRILLYLCMYVSFLCSMNVWFAWNKAGGRIQFVLTVLMLFCIVVGKIKLEVTRRNVWSFLLLSIAYFAYNFTFNNFKSVIALLGVLLTFWIIINLNTDDQRECLKFITQWFAILMIPSLVLWLVDWVIPLPAFGTVKIDNEVLSYLPYDNHILFVKGIFYYYRFNGPFLEPGHLGMMSAFLVYANRFNFRDWRVIAISIILLFSLSLAGYMLMAIGFCFNRFASDPKFIRTIFLAVVLMIPLYFISVSYNGGHNFINERILARLEYDEDKGFTGNNRVFGQIDDYYRFLLNNSRYFWTGYDKKVIKWLAEDQNSRGNGYVYWVVRFGFLGLIIVALPYLYYALSSRRRKYAMLFFLFVCFAFWQRTYPFWTSWLICYMWGISLYEADKQAETKSSPSRSSIRLPRGMGETQVG